MKKGCLRTLGTVMVLLLVLSGNVFAQNENDSQTGIDGVKNLFGMTTSQAVGVSYHTHIQNVGWETNWVSNSITSGTYGQSLRLEGIEIKLTGDVPDGAKIEYRTHVQNVGWETYWANNGGTAGTQGMGLRLEGIQIRLVNMPDYSIEYRTHVQNVGWETNWAKDGETAGTQGQSLRLEGIQIRIIKEDADLTAYNKILATTKQAIKTNYTTYSWDKLQSVIKSNVVTVKSTQEQVDAATKAIKTAYAALESETTAKVYSSAGTYGPSSGLETINQDVIIKSDGVTLQNMHITGDLIISEEVGQGNATLNNITVDGETYVRGGGKNSIHINGGNYKRITIQETASGQVRIVATNANGLDVVIAEDAGGEDVILDGSFDSVQVDAPKMKISTQGATTIKEMTVSKAGAGSQVNLDANSQVDSMVFNGKADVKGQGNIAKSRVNADNVTYERAPGQQTVGSNVKVPPKTPVVTVPVTGITLTGAGSATTVAKAGTLQITAAVTPANASNNRVTWSIVNGTGTASISNSGVVTGLTAGTVTVNATAQDGSGKIGTLTLTVTDVTAGTIATVSSISSSTVNPTFTITLTNDTFTATANTTSNWTNAMGATGLTVSSITRYSNNQVIINTTGTAAVGTITFKANAAALTKNLASNTVTVTVNPVMVSAISVTGTGGATTVTKGSTLQMLATVTPSTAVNKNLTWSVVNGTGSAAISSTGLLTPATAGTVTVKATAIDGSAVSGSATITIQEVSAGVLASNSSLLIGASNPSIVITLTNDTFSSSAGSTSLWVVDAGTTGLTVSSVTRNSNTQVTIATTGTAKTGSLKIKASSGAMTKGVVSNELTVTAAAQAVTAVAITGTTTVGSTLTATITPTGATVGYQWQRGDTATGSFDNISSATAATYVLTGADQGKYIKVVATGTGNFTGTVTYTTSSWIVGSADATLKSSSTIKGVTIKSLGVPSSTLDGSSPGVTKKGSVIISGDQAQNTSNTGEFVTAFEKTDTNATIKVVKFAKSASNAGFEAANAYSNEAITDGDYFIIKVTGKSGSVEYYWIDVTVDATKPIVTATVQSVTNVTGQSVKVQSNESNGKVYIIKTGVAQSTVTEFENQVSTKNGAKADVYANGTDIVISTEGLSAGTYYAYAVDAVGNISDRGSNPITVTVSAEEVGVNSVTANGSSGATTTTELTLTLAKDVNLAKSDVTLTGATLDTVTDNDNGTYILGISNISVSNGANVTVALSKAGYAFNPTSKTVAVNVANVAP
ncbi:Ig-like domain-containing protein [Acetobacterium wieringae]|uniref:Ig-like domain-containing protein n=1 Tax=Acetobacterium wieringae TaxID=52694 RepID=UPI002B1FC327|nr:Ig-like domain-containing protein [Acetobacterium wieringae]MEA4806856.1 Ig-like domain-containing protein [Acetobacterium wieringae]